MSASPEIPAPFEAENDGSSGPGLDWIIVGGESGHGARPCDRRWIYSVIDQCKASGVAVFVKQLGARSIIDGVETTAISERDARLMLASKKGGDMSEWPDEYLRVREFPSPDTKEP